MRTNCVPKHSRDHADSGCDVVHKEAEFIGNKQTNSPTHSQTNKHTNTQLHILVPGPD